MIQFVDMTLLAFLVIVALAVTRTLNLFATVVLTGVYSLLMACIFTVLDAVDVAFTEAAVGAGMSTAVLLGAMLLTSRTAKPEKSLRQLGPLLVCIATGIMLIYATVDLPAVGDPNSPANTGVGLTYLRVAWFDTGIENVVTPVLGSYRGFDTLGETTVVFVAGIAVALLLGFGERSLAETIRNEDKSLPKATTKPDPENEETDA